MTDPRQVVVVGAGIVGLSTAWFLQEHGVEVTVLDRRGVAAGASWGNAGWVTPAQAVPINEPTSLRAGVVSLLRSDAPISVDPFAGPAMWGFLARFSAHCTPRRFSRSREGLRGLNEAALDAYDQLAAGGVSSAVRQVSIIAAVNGRDEVDHLEQLGGELLTREQARGLAPQVRSSVAHLVRLPGARYVEPAPFVAALASSVTERGGSILAGRTVSRVAAGVLTTDRGAVAADAVVIATGAEISRLARPLGVRVPVRAGRGYSFTVAIEEPVPAPIYLPHERIACTPYRGRLRLAGTMEFASARAPARAGRIDAMVRAATAILTGIDWSDRQDDWVGARPLTPDGLPVVGATRVPRTYVAGGHGMWGITQGPATGRLLARSIVTDRLEPALHPLDPLR